MEARPRGGPPRGRGTTGGFRNTGGRHPMGVRGLDDRIRVDTGFGDREGNVDGHVGDGAGVEGVGGRGRLGWSGLEVRGGRYGKLYGIAQFARVQRVGNAIGTWKGSLSKLMGCPVPVEGGYPDFEGNGREAGRRELLFISPNQKPIKNNRCLNLPLYSSTSGRTICAVCGASSIPSADQV